jgi:hypothetical protein
VASLGAETIETSCVAMHRQHTAAVTVTMLAHAVNYFSFRAAATGSGALMIPETLLLMKRNPFTKGARRTGM